MSVNLVEAQQFVTDGLVAFYTLDKADIKAGVVKNESGNGNDAKIMGTNSPLIVTAKIGQPLQLNGKKVYVEIPSFRLMATYWGSFYLHVGSR